MPHNLQKSKKLIDQVWEKAASIQGLPPEMYRLDCCGAIMKKDLFMQGTKSLSMSWEIDHIKPLENGGKDDLTNLQPLQWENNRCKAGEYPSWNCHVKAVGQINTYTNSLYKNCR